MSAPLLTGRTLLVLCLVSAGWAFSFGLGAPLASLWLHDRAYSESVVGLAGGVYYLGIAVTAAVVPWLMRRWGRSCALAGFVLSGLAVVLFPWGGSLLGWFVLRLLHGVGGAMSLIPTETYVNLHSPPAQRARTFGFYAVAIAVGWALGNLAGLQMYDAVPRLAFVAGGLVTLAAVPLLWRGLPWPAEPPVPAGGRVPLPWRRSTLSLGSAWGQGFLEGSMVSLLPIYLLFLGLSKDEISFLTSGIMIGVILFQVPVAWLADRLGRTAVLLACYAVVLAGLVALPLCPGKATLAVCLFLTGACSGAFYPLGLSLLGEQVADDALSRANACFLALNCIGSLVGPVVTGVVMDCFGNQAMAASGVAATILVLVVWMALRPTVSLACASGLCPAPQARSASEGTSPRQAA